MKRLSLLLLLAACGPLPDDYAGTVTEWNGHIVEIEGVWDGSARQAPTPAMLASATSLCGRPARFLNSTPKPVHYGPSSSFDTYLTLFRFACGN